MVDFQLNRLGRISLVSGAALIGAMALWSYWPALSGDYVLDDDVLLTNNRLVQAPDGLYRMWFTTEPTDYWPLTSTTFWLEWRLWGANPTGYHVVNLLLHVVECLLLWRILQCLSIPGAFLAALLFAVHPVNVESVAWIAQRKNVLAMLFYLLSVLWYLRAEERPTPWNRWYWLSLVGFLLAMLSKGSVAVLPLVLLLLVWWQRPLSWRDLAKTAPFFAIAAALTLVNIWFQTHGAEQAVRQGTLLERLLGAGAVVWFYLWKAVFPWHLSFLYPQWHIQPGDWHWWVPLVATIGVTLLLWLRRHSYYGRPLLFAWSYFCIALLPVMGFTYVGFMRYSLVADHYQHLALLGVVGLAGAVWSAWLNDLVRDKQWMPFAIAAFALVILAWVGRTQSRHYETAIELYEATLIENPESWLAHYNLGLALQNSGQLSAAIEHYQQAARNNPKNAAIQNNYGQALNEEVQPAEAIKHFDAALRIDPKSARALAGKGNALLLLKRAPDAVECFQRALDLDPDDAQTVSAMALALMSVGKLTEALPRAQQAVEMAPDSVEVHNNLALVYGRAGRQRDAINEFRRAIAIKSSDPSLLRNLGFALSQSGNPAEAIGHLERYLQSVPNDVGVWALLVVDYDQTGRTGQAVAAAQQAVKLARAQQKPELAQQLEGWLATKGVRQPSVPADVR